MSERNESDPTRGERKYNGEILPRKTDRPSAGLPFLRSQSSFLLKRKLPLEHSEGNEIAAEYLRVQKTGLPACFTLSDYILPINHFYMILYLFSRIKKFPLK